VKPGRIVVVPSCEPGQGGGHVSRALALVRDLRGMGREAWVFLPGRAGPAQAETMSAFFRSGNFDSSWLITEGELGNVADKDVECIVLDRFQTPPDEFQRWKEIAPLVGIDEGGPCRNRFDFLIDILVPHKLGNPPPNISDPSLLQVSSNLPPQIRGETENLDLEVLVIKVLVSFGREDNAGLGITTARALAQNNSTGSMDITLLGRGKDGKELEKLPHVRVLETIPNLGEYLTEYDLLITHYGITAYEALYAKTPVALVSPTAYHEKLAKAAGFYSAGIGKSGAEKLAGLLLGGTSFLRKLKKRRTVLARKYNLDREPSQSLAGLVSGFSVMASRDCPVCGGPVSGKSLFRFPERTYCRCPKCAVLYMNRTGKPPVEYGREYFFELYQKQYGKTYIEDFPNLIAAGKRRLGIIKTMLPAASPCSLLDIGCAYGPFLAAAREEGFSPVGIDPAEDAVNYVNQNLGIPAIQGFFPDCPVPDTTGCAPPYDAVTLWFVIEHFRNCVPAFAEIRKILKPGGVLAFSTPSFSGISGRSSLGRFLENSPGDHWTVWSPAAARKALRLAGFRVQKIAVTGHHPERFPLLGKLVKGKNNPLYRLLLAFSKAFALGDTFEVYATALPQKEAT